MPATPPTGAPLRGRFVRLDVMTMEDAPGLHAVYTDPAVYGQGFIMRPPRADLAATRANTEENIAAGARGRTAYTVRLTGEGGLGDAGTVVGTSSLGDVDLENERIHLGWTMYGSRWWGTQVNPECKLLLLGHAFECGFGPGQDPDRRGERSGRRPRSPSSGRPARVCCGGTPGGRTGASATRWCSASCATSGRPCGTGSRERLAEQRRLRRIPAGSTRSVRASAGGRGSTSAAARR